MLTSEGSSAELRSTKEDGLGQSLPNLMTFTSFEKKPTLWSQIGQPKFGLWVIDIYDIERETLSGFLQGAGSVLVFGVPVG